MYIPQNETGLTPAIVGDTLAPPATGIASMKDHTTPIPIRPTPTTVDPSKTRTDGPIHNTNKITCSRHTIKVRVLCLHGCGSCLKLECLGGLIGRVAGFHPQHHPSALCSRSALSAMRLPTLFGQVLHHITSMKLKGSGMGREGGRTSSLSGGYCITTYLPFTNVYDRWWHFTNIRVFRGPLVSYPLRINCTLCHFSWSC